jgi:hypothetical protein
MSNESGEIEHRLNKKSNLNVSCFSDGQIDDEDEDREFGEPIIKLRDFTKRSEEKYANCDP